MLLQDAPNGAPAYFVSELLELAHDALVTPAVFLLQVCDDIPLAAIHPACDHQHEKPQRVVEHGSHFA